MSFRHMAQGPFDEIVYMYMYVYMYKPKLIDHYYDIKTMCNQDYGKTICFHSGKVFGNYHLQDATILVD